ncbi:acetoacetyl-CoA reductase [Pseudothauera rhizosphaerae]|uniref:Acetoacetyl-CoA reductase n=1 Tax=Pseudothauera rhizosphaerae TaxID=2565932 RepID=A0A4S4APS4_9RHOO|nr:acetoacetyl-CoA reductase [Pseudothauera rhizosphaerae]THF61705.1 acetoacetyl-CoA reductase [Pseudothauera rhizosphaerae]
MATERRTALITGGMGGLGQAIARVLHDAGHTVLVTHSPGNSRADAWLQGQAAAGYEFQAYGVDIADKASCRELGHKLRTAGHHVDILVNNGGITRDVTFRKMSEDDWDAVLRANLDSVFNVTRQVINDMTERHWGRIVNISSINGNKGQFGQTNYCAAKAGMHGFTMALAQEVANKGITVNTVSPGYLDTRMVAAVPRDVLESQIIARIPVGRLGRPEEVAALVGFICSEEAAFMTGSNVSMNGGQHMH